ncbi:MAG: rod shape-determining protein MreD [Candidatus Cloacimonadota bacterium]|nr:rod shape-determining protein MreD [Candidatus Cloacimonadota bacterium]
MWLRGIYTYLVGLFFLYLQVLIVPALAIADVVPLILLPWLIYTVWYQAQKIALPVVFLIGIMYDTLAPLTFGMHALSFCLLAILINILRIPFEQDSLVAKLIVISSSNLFFALFTLLVYGLFHGFDSTLYWLSLAGFGYNLIFSLVVFFLMQLISRLRLVIKNE